MKTNQKFCAKCLKGQPYLLCQTILFLTLGYDICHNLSEHLDETPLVNIFEVYFISMFNSQCPLLVKNLVNCNMWFLNKLNLFAAKYK